MTKSIFTKCYNFARVAPSLTLPDQNYYTACVNKSASLKEHFFLEKLYVNLEKVYNNMIGNIISFYRILFCVMWMFGLEIMANLVKSLQICLVWFTNITAFTTGDNLSISAEEK